MEQMHGNVAATDALRDRAALEAAGARFRGQLLFPGEHGYDEARRVWNGLIDRKPGLIVRCSGTADVIDGVNLAREHGLLLSIRGGGHNIAGTAVCEGGLMLDLSLLKGIRLDPAAGTVAVQPGATWGDVDRETQILGFAVPSGIISATGVAGLTLGGGFGWLTRKYGLTCDSLLSADVVTAEGRLVTASATRNPELFWAIRGGGGNFGVVTNFEFRVRPVGPQVMAGMVVFPMDRAPDVIDLFREVTASAPDELTCLLILRVAPPAPFLPKEIHGAPIAAIAACHCGPPDEAEGAVKSLRRLASPVADTFGFKPFVVHQTMLDSGQPFGRCYYWKSEYLHELSGGARDTLVARSRTFTSPHSGVLVMHLGGEAARVADDETAAGNREANYVLNIAGSWIERDDSERHVRWAQEYWRAMRPFSTGGNYVNFLTDDETDDRVREAYGAAKLARLAELKAKHDPENLFRCNKNIVPAGRAVDRSPKAALPTMESRAVRSHVDQR